MLTTIEAMHGKAQRRRVNAAMLCGSDGGLQDTINRYAEGLRMAAGGGATTAYRCRIENDKLLTVPTTALRTDCARVADAQEQLNAGQEVTVAGPDVEMLRQRLAAWGVR